MMKSKLTQLLFMTAFVELVAPSCRRRHQGAKAHGRNPALICSPNGWPTAVHLKGPATMAVVGGKLRVCRLMARSTKRSSRFHGSHPQGVSRGFSLEGLPPAARAAHRRDGSPRSNR